MDLLAGIEGRFQRAAETAAGVRRAVLAACDPAAAVARSWPGEMLGDGSAGAVRVLAVGKAAAPMARRALALLGGDGGRRARAGVPALVVTTPHADMGVPGAEVVVADHPLPTARNLAAAARVVAFVRAVAVGETLLVLLSGGGSALLTAPAGGLTLDDLREATSALLHAGAAIGELNTVRKHCERLKGGRLAGVVGMDGATGGGGGERPRVVVLVVSDVIGDRLDVISSGPLAADPTTYADALRVLRERRVDGVPALARVVEHLGRGTGGGLTETPKPGDAVFERVTHRVIASNQVAAVAARDALLEAGFGRVKVVCGVEGEAAETGRGLVRDVAAHAREAAEGVGVFAGASAVVYAGETTVAVGDALGRGGRNQEAALAAAIEMGRLGPAMAMAVMTLATDGVDGPTDAAGAVVTSQTAKHARARGVDLERALALHDSHTALEALGCLVRTGPTGTNVNDVAVGMVWGSG